MIGRVVIFTLLVGFCSPSGALAQEHLKIAYSSADASNTVWFTALDGGIYKKYGLDVELIFIQSSTMGAQFVVLSRTNFNRYFHERPLHR